MERSKFVRVLLGTLVLGSMIMAGCKKDEEDPATVPVPSAPQAAVPADPAPAGSDTGSGSNTGAEAPSAAAAAPPQPATPSTAPVAKKGESIDACCSALRAVQKSGKTAIAKSKAASAAAVCPGISKLVKDGTITRSAGLTQVRSALSGFDVPGECR